MTKLFVMLFGFWALCFDAGAAEKIIVVTHGQAADPFWTVVKNGVEQAGQDLRVEVEYHAPETFDMAAMARLIEGAVAKRPDGLVVSIPDGDALKRPLEKARKRGIPVISINSGGEHQQALDILLHVGQSEYEAGYGAGQKLRKLGASIGLCVNHEQGNLALDRRCAGFKKGMNGQSATLAVNMDPTAIRNSTMAYLKQHPEVDGVLTVGSISAPSVVQSIRKLGKASTVRLGTFDSSPEILKAIKDGGLTFAVDQQQYLQGYLAVQTMTQYKRLGLIPTGAIHTGPGFITKQNADEFLELAKRGIR